MMRICNSEEIDKDMLKQSQAMVNELCEEFMKTLDSCTNNMIGDHRDCSTPLVNRSASQSFSEPNQLLSLGSYVPPSRQNSGMSNASSENLGPDVLLDRSSPDRSSSRISGEFHAAGIKRAEKLPSTYFLSIADRFEDLYLKAEAIPTVAFLGKFPAVAFLCARLSNFLQ